MGLWYTAPLPADASYIALWRKPRVRPGRDIPATMTMPLSKDEWTLLS
jgi:hypothetical protein